MPCSTTLTCFCRQPFSIKDPRFFAFSECFETFVFVIGPFLFLALISAYFIGHLRPPDISLRVPSSFRLRKMSVAFTLILTLGAFLNDLILFKQSVSAVLLVSYIARILTLFIHFVFLWRLGLIHFDYKRGPSMVTISWFLTIPFYVVRMERLIQELKIADSVNVEINKAINIFCVAVMICCQFAYLVTIIQGNNRYRTVSMLSQSSESTENLLFINGTHERYYDIDAADFPADQLETACPVDSASCISKLLFCWVQPLMSRGSKRLLNKETSVYQLPNSLGTEMLCSSFVDTFKDITINEDLHNTTAEHLGQKPKRNVLKTLHTLFGVKYYLLGFLKFGADALGFGGPIFLNLLVKFVESDQPISTGCIYAAALFASTLVGSLLSTHFDYQVNVKNFQLFEICLPLWKSSLQTVLVTLKACAILD